MGKMEVVHRGSRQCHPSCKDYDSGVDDLQNPRFYIVWNMNMNTHIYPEFVVSFKISSKTEGEYDSFRVLFCFIIISFFPTLRKNVWSHIILHDMHTSSSISEK